MAGEWVGTGAANVEDDANDLVLFPITANGSFRAVGLIGQTITSTVARVTTPEAQDRLLDLMKGIGGLASVTVLVIWCESV